MTDKRIKWLFVLVSAVLTIILAIQYGQIEEYKALSLSYESADRDYSMAKQRLQAEEDSHEQTKATLVQLENDYSLLEQIHETSEVRISQLEGQLMKVPGLLNADSQWALQEKYGEAYQWIPEELLLHSELIERPGVLGGTMMFRKAWLLTDRLVLAAFDDGHIMGSGIYEFNQGPEEALQWSMLVEHIDGEDFFPVLQGDLRDWDVWQSHLYNTKNVSEVIGLYREDMNDDYLDDFGMRLMTMYLSNGADVFVDELYASKHTSTKVIERLFLEEVQSAGDIFGLNDKTVEKDLRKMMDPNRVDFIVEFIEVLEGMDQ